MRAAPILALGRHLGKGRNELRVTREALAAPRRVSA
jgi:hypothetical protein